jgi:hypothetical protein
MAQDADQGGQGCLRQANTILQGARHLLLRGKQAAAAEWSLLCACHNLRKLFAVRGADGLARLAPA